MKIPLFDIDGTLVNPINILHEKSFAIAVEEVFGIKTDLSKINSQGKIDSQIFIELLEFYGIPREKSKEKLPELFFIMGNYFIKHENETRAEALPGVTELCEELYEKNIPMAVLTGNLEVIGWKKLEQIDLKKFLTAGAFGNMALKRSDLISIILKKLQLEYNEQIQKSNLVIIGDTPLDIRCAKEGKIYSIGVATGKYSKEELKNEGADLVVDSMLQKQELLDFLLN